MNNNKKVTSLNLFYYLKKILISTSVFFMFYTLILSYIGYFLFPATNAFTPESMVYNLFFSISFGISVIAFEIKKLPVFSKYIISFIILYGGFVLFQIILAGRVFNKQTIPFLTVAFFIIYLVAVGIINITKSIKDSKISKKQIYKPQFNDLKNNKHDTHNK